MTIMKSMQHGFAGAKWTVLGTATGTVIMACLSATGLSIILQNSPDAYGVLRTLGGLYMIWLGVKNWRAKTVSLTSAVKKKALQEAHDKAHEATYKADAARIRRFPFFLEGIVLQLTNPMLIMFFVSLFPQFIDPTKDHNLQFSVLAFTYFALVIVIHSGYSVVITRFKTVMSNPTWTRWIYRAGGTIFMFLGVVILRQVAQQYLGLF